MSPAGWLPRNGISSGTLRSVIEYGLPFYCQRWINNSWEFSCVECVCSLGLPRSQCIIGVSGWLHLKSCWVHTQVTKNVLSSFGYWGQNVDLSLKPIRIHAMEGRGSPHIYTICNSAINWLDCGNSFSEIQTDCLWQTICILERQLLVSIMQNQHSSYLISSIRNSDESCPLGVWLFHDNAPVQKSLVAQQALCNCEFV